MFMRPETSERTLGLSRERWQAKSAGLPSAQREEEQRRFFAREAVSLTSVLFSLEKTRMSEKQNESVPEGGLPVNIGS